jgi:hypothetical protein
MPAVRQPIEFDERETHALVKAVPDVTWQTATRKNG